MVIFGPDALVMFGIRQDAEPEGGAREGRRSSCTDSARAAVIDGMSLNRIVCSHASLVVNARPGRTSVTIYGSEATKVFLRG